MPGTEAHGWQSPLQAFISKLNARVPPPTPHAHPAARTAKADARSSAPRTRSAATTPPACTSLIATVRGVRDRDAAPAERWRRCRQGCIRSGAVMAPCPCRRACMLPLRSDGGNACLPARRQRQGAHLLRCRLDVPGRQVEAEGGSPQAGWPCYCNVLGIPDPRLDHLAEGPARAVTSRTTFPTYCAVPTAPTRRSGNAQTAPSALARWVAHKARTNAP